MKVVVTGATGFVGKYLIDELLRQKDEVTVIVRDIRHIPESWKNKVSVIEESMEHFSKLESVDFPWEEADLFFHLGWEGTAGERRADVALQLQNIMNTYNAVELAGRLRCKRFINTGSIMEYEAMQYIPTENALPGKGYIYSTAKMSADFIAKTAAINKQIEYINALISNIYGSGEKSERFINTTVRKMLKNERIPLTQGVQLYDFIYITDAVKEIILAGKYGEKNSVYYIGNKEPRTLKSFVLQMKEILNSDSELLFGKIPYRGAMLTYQEFDTKKISQLGFYPEITFEQGITFLKKWILEGEKR